MPITPAQIIARMEALGISQSELARRAGITRANVNRYLNGKASIYADNLEKIVGVLGGTVSVKWNRARRGND